MAHSLEARLPFLDQELVDYILTLPRRAIIHNGWTRAIVRQSLRGVLPRKVEARRKKIGFTTPEFRWYRRQRAALQSLLRSPRFSARVSNSPARVSRSAASKSAKMPTAGSPTLGCGWCMILAQVAGDVIPPA